MNPDILKAAKLWRRKLSKGELVGVVHHYNEVIPSASKGQLIKSLMDAAIGFQ